ncbi:MAG TPA: hypothetical protein VFW65_05920 [Pseudonocardiaceae bacterium]|nr:hypothetical protein [Pseudonocardiaceae bacterium]
MLGQRYADSADELTDSAVEIPAPEGRALPDWRVVTHRRVMTVCERVLGECFVPNARTGVAVLAAIIGALTVIAVTLSVGNALLVLFVAAVMRIACERRR